MTLLHENEKCRKFSGFDLIENSTLVYVRTPTALALMLTNSDGMID
jgi:hypothetical protein